MLGEKPAQLLGGKHAGIAIGKRGHHEAARAVPGCRTEGKIVKDRGLLADELAGPPRIDSRVSALFPGVAASRAQASGSVTFARPLVISAAC